MKHGSLFSGIGGFDLAASWMGWENVFHCENNEFCQKVLHKHFPNSIQHGDITTTDFSTYNGRVDIVTGGFPCQPYSQAGKRKGKADDRHLWPQMLRAIREIQPAWIVGENVPGLLNWERGMVLAEIYADLEAAGFEVFPPVILPACGKNAPHRRDRLWIVAHATSNRSDRASNESGSQIEGQNGEQVEQLTECGKVWDAANSNSTRRIQYRRTIPNEEWNDTHKEQGRDKQQNGFVGCTKESNIAHPNSSRLPGRIQPKERQDGETNGAFKGSELARTCPKSEWREFPTQSPVCGGDDGIPDRVDRIKALGNAIVPQVAYEIFKSIESIA